MSICSDNIYHEDNSELLSSKFLRKENLIELQR